MVAKRTNGKREWKIAWGSVVIGWWNFKKKGVLNGFEHTKGISWLIHFTRARVAQLTAKVYPQKRFEADDRWRRRCNACDTGDRGSAAAAGIAATTGRLVPNRGMSATVASALAIARATARAKAPAVAQAVGTAKNGSLRLDRKQQDK